jgi:hypothetical protein
MNRTLLGLALLGGLAALPARAQQAATYDLRGDYRYKVGDKIKVHERNETHAKYAIKSGAKVLNSVDTVEGYEQRYEEEVQEVSAAGDITKSVRTYTFAKVFATDQTLDLSQKPLKVQMALAEDGTFGFTALDPAVPIPEVLQEILDQDAGKKETEEEDQSARRLVMPAERQAVGATWSVPLSDVCELFRFEPDQVQQEGYEGKGKLEAAERQGELTMLRATVGFKLPLKKFNELECEKPMAFDTVIRLSMPVDAGGPEVQSSMDGTMKGIARIPEDQGFPPGSTYDLDMRIVITQTIERAK